MEDDIGMFKAFILLFKDVYKDVYKGTGSIWAGIFCVATLIFITLTLVFFFFACLVAIIEVIIALLRHRG